MCHQPPAFVRAPKEDVCVERVYRALDDNLSWVDSFDTAEALRAALQVFRGLFNRERLIKPHKLQLPLAVRSLLPQS